MCIIAAKPTGVKMPSDEILENMWYGNDDGAGFMYAENGSVHIRKGFMTYEDFKKALDEFLSTHDPEQTPLVMHFRITTHGGTKAENCHPFPISDSVGMLTKPESKCRIGVAHNGIIPITPRKGISDTMEYIISQLAPLSRAVPDFYRNKDLMKMISNATNSKLAFMNGRGDIYTVGDFVEQDGIKYSNHSFEWSWNSKRWGNYSYGYGGWSDYTGYDDWDYGYTGKKDAQNTARMAFSEDDGCFLEMSVMWLDENFGYITGVPEYDPDDAYAIDKDGNVYVYDWEIDALIRMSGATAYSNTGTVVRYDPTSKSVMRELVFFRYLYKQGKKLEASGTNKKSKK